MNDPMETEEVEVPTYGYSSYTPMSMAVGMSTGNYMMPNYDYPNYPIQQNFGFFNNQVELEEEHWQRHNQFPNYFANNLPTYSDVPPILSRLRHPTNIEVLPQRVQMFEQWEDNVQPTTPPRVSLPFQVYNEPREVLESNQLNNSFGQLISNSNPANQEPALSAGNESDWYQDELWEGVSHGSFDQTHNNANISSPLSSQLGEELPSQCDLMVLNEISSIIDPLDKDLNDSGSLDGSDPEPFEKKRKIEDYVKNERINIPMETKEPQLNWDKLPGKIINAVKRGCRYYFTRCKGIRLESVCLTLDQKPIETQKKFEKFIVRYKRTWKTWEEITNYVSEEGDNEMAWVLMELVSNFLSNKDDVEIWLNNTRIIEKEKIRIRLNKDIMKESFILHFYPISQSWIKNVY